VSKGQAAAGEKSHPLGTDLHWEGMKPFGNGKQATTHKEDRRK